MADLGAGARGPWPPPLLANKDENLNNVFLIPRHSYTIILVECIHVTFIAETSSVGLSRVYTKVNYAIQGEIGIVIK